VEGGSNMLPALALACPLHTIFFAILNCAQRTRKKIRPKHWLLACYLLVLVTGFCVIWVFALENY